MFKKNSKNFSKKFQNKFEFEFLLNEIRIIQTEKFDDMKKVFDKFNYLCYLYLT